MLKGFRAFGLATLGLLLLPITASAQRLAAGSVLPLDTQLLRTIEENVLPPVLVEGPAAHATLADYYFAANAELVFRFQHAREILDRGTPRPHRMVTLIAGSAGAGKTFLKGQVLGTDHDPQEICSFDIKDLYLEWMQEDRAFHKPDLYSQDIVLNTLPALRDPQWPGLYDFLQKQKALFYVIDSLDEIHPDDYLTVLEQIERFAFEGGRPFVHVVLLGRGLAFRDYWAKKAGYYPTAMMNLYALETPEFRTTGDLAVSSWNYHQFAHKLRWAGGDGDRVSVRDFVAWTETGFQRSGRFANLETTPVDAVVPSAEQLLSTLACQERYVNSVLRNLAGNSILRQVISDRVRSHLPYDERAIKEEYFNRWLQRDTRSDDRPSDSKPEYLRLYLELLESLAAKYLRDGKLDSRGFFVMEDDDTIDVVFRGQPLQFKAYRILNRSGLKYLDPRTPGSRRYRFEPIWFHRLLVDRYNERMHTVERRLTIRLDERGNLEINSEPAQPDQLEPMVREACRDASGNLVVVILAHDQCPLRSLLDAVAACRQSRIKDVQIRSLETPAPQSTTLKR